MEVGGRKSGIANRKASRRALAPGGVGTPTNHYGKLIILRTSHSLSMRNTISPKHSHVLHRANTFVEVSLSDLRLISSGIRDADSRS